MERFDYTDPICPFNTDEYATTPEEAASSGVVSISEIIQRLDRLYAREDLEKAGQLLKTSLAEARRLGDKRGELSLLNELLGYHRQYGNMAEEETTIADTKRLLTELDLGENDTAGTILINIGTAQCASGHPEEALLSYSDACRSWGKLLPADHPKFAVLYNNMAGACEASGDNEQAKLYYRKAITILQKAGPQPDTAVSLINLARLLRSEAAEDTAADDCVKEALKLLQNSGLVKDAYYAHTCRKCQEPLLYLGYFRAARELREEADAIYGRNR